MSIGVRRGDQSTCVAARQRQKRLGDLHEPSRVLEGEAHRRGQFVRGARLEQGDLQVALQRGERIAQLVCGIRGEPAELFGHGELARSRAISARTVSSLRHAVTTTATNWNLAVNGSIGTGESGGERHGHGGRA